MRTALCHGPLDGMKDFVISDFLAACAHGVLDRILNDRLVYYLNVHLDKEAEYATGCLRWSDEAW